MNSPLWQRTTRIVSLSLLIILLLGNIAQAQPANQQTPSAAHQVFLPLVIGSNATNPPVDPVAVHFISDPQRATHAAIGPEGGTLSATAADGTHFDLVIPPDALDFTETITMTPVLQAQNLPLSGGLIGAVNLEPVGLNFTEMATLTISPASAAAGPLTVGFGYNGQGEQFHLRPLIPAVANPQLQAAAPLVKIGVITIRPVGAASGTQADLNAQQAQPAPSDPMDAAAQQLALKDDLFAEGLAEIFDHIVRPDLEKATTNVQAVDVAITQFDQWLAWVDALDMRAHFISQFAEGKNLIGTILAHASVSAAERCISQKRPEEGFRLLRLMRYAKKYESAADVSAIQAKLRGCLTFELTFHSHLTEQAPGYGYEYTLEASKVMLQATTGTRATGGGPLNWLTFSWTAGGPCAFNTIGTPSTLNAQSLPFGLSITPVSRMSPAVNITLHYDPGTPSEQVTILCPGAPPLTSNTTGWRSYFEKMHADERVGNGYRVTSQIVGAGSFTGWVYHLTTTGPGGQAAVEDTQITINHTPQP